jgi:predicted peptidase
MKYLFLITVFNLSFSAFAQQDLFYVPKDLKSKAPALIITSCTGATKADLDSNKAIADKLGWVLATCAGTKNHQDASLNDRYIYATYQSLISKNQIDQSRVYIYGFSGQAVQAMMAVFLHPSKFKGAVAICAHAGAMPYANWEMLKDKKFYLISRDQDWNLLDNRTMHQAFLENGISDTLVVTRGQHGPKTRRELFEACKWLQRKTN